MPPIYETIFTARFFHIPPLVTLWLSAWAISFTAGQRTVECGCSTLELKTIAI